MNVFMLRTFWIRSPRSRVKRCETDLRHALQWDHRHSRRDAHLQLREVGNGASPRRTLRAAACDGRCLSSRFIATKGVYARRAQPCPRSGVERTSTHDSALVTALRTRTCGPRKATVVLERRSPPS